MAMGGNVHDRPRSQIREPGSLLFESFGVRKICLGRSYAIPLDPLYKKTFLVCSFEWGHISCTFGPVYASFAPHVNVYSNTHTNVSLGVSSTVPACNAALHVRTPVNGCNTGLSCIPGVSFGAPIGVADDISAPLFVTLSQLTCPSFSPPRTTNSVGGMPVNDGFRTCKRLHAPRTPQTVPRRNDRAI